MGQFSVCDEAIDRLQVKLAPIVDLMPSEDKPIGYGFDQNDRPSVMFKSGSGITAFRDAASKFGPETRLADWIEKRSAVLAVHHKYLTAHQ
jgi:hypothetical protein